MANFMYDKAKAWLVDLDGTRTELTDIKISLTSDPADTWNDGDAPASSGYASADDVVWHSIAAPNNLFTIIHEAYTGLAGRYVGLPAWPPLSVDHNYAHGCIVAASGGPLSACPHPVGSKAWKSWQQGFMNSQHLGPDYRDAVAEADERIAALKTTVDPKIQAMRDLLDEVAS